MILANKKYMVELDELQRKVQLNSLAITVGVTIVAGVPYSVMNAYHVIPFKADVSHLVFLMCLTVFVSNLYGTRRYR
jgi:ABC-type glycerol-3-phosphate transport system permease component